MTILFLNRILNGIVVLYSNAESNQIPNRIMVTLCKHSLPCLKRSYWSICSYHRWIKVYETAIKPWKMLWIALQQMWWTFGWQIQQKGNKSLSDWATNKTSVKPPFVNIRICRNRIHNLLVEVTSQNKTNMAVSAKCERFQDKIGVWMIT
jgi:hypothetical protein